MTDIDVLALNQLAYRYAAAVDACDVEMFRSVFTANGRLRAYHPDADEPFADLSGAELARVPNTMRGKYRHTMHGMTNHLVDVDGDRASGTVLCVARHLDPAGETALNVMIRYVDRYEREDRIWKIADRQIRFLWSERHVAVDSGY